VGDSNEEDEDEEDNAEDNDDDDEDDDGDVDGIASSGDDDEDDDGSDHESEISNEDRISSDGIDGSISGENSVGECEGGNVDVSVEADSCSVTSIPPLGTRFIGHKKMSVPSNYFALATNRPGASTMAKKATSRFKQWMGRRNVAALPVKPPSPKKKHSSFQQERWLMNIAGARIIFQTTVLIFIRSFFLR
jgi:hypothetical protein